MCFFLWCPFPSSLFVYPPLIHPMMMQLPNSWRRISIDPLPSFSLLLPLLSSNKAPYYLLRSLLFFSLLLLPPDPMYCNWDPSLSSCCTLVGGDLSIMPAPDRPSAPSRQSCIFIIVVVVVVVTRAVELTRIIPERRKPATEILEDLTCRLSLELEI